MVKTNSIFEHVSDLCLPLGKYAVVGSGVLSAWGVREHKDIDILVIPELYQSLEQLGWEKELEHGFLTKDGIEVGTNIFSYGNYQPDIYTLIREADIINGIPFVKLIEVIKFRTALGREKDLNDIKLIEDFLRKKT